jgi:tetratricopeptide (TPR) repeat protein
MYFKRYLYALVLAGQTIFCSVSALAQNSLGAEANRAKNRADAISFLNKENPSSRASGLAVLSQIGLTADADKIVPLLNDREPQLRNMASEVIWRVWSRTGNPQIDQEFTQAFALMQSNNLEAAHRAFSVLIQKQPRFAEAWNKRATILFLQGKLQESLKDCDQVIKLNPNHFGALSGMAQIHMKLGQFKQALERLEQAQIINPSLEGTQELIEQIKALEREQAKVSI